MSKLQILSLFLFSPFSSFAANSMTETKFDQILDRVIHSMESSKKIKLIKDWESDDFVMKPLDHGDHFSLTVAGGIARHWTVTEDAFALMACHELGHFFGGAPLYGEEAITKENTHLSIEGQSDYWSIAKCFRKLIEKENNEEILKEMAVTEKYEFIRETIIPSTQSVCKKAWSSKKNINICRRSLLAGYSYAKTARIARMERYWVDFATPSKNIAPYTQVGHPSAQCRLDTFTAASLCKISPEIEVSSSDPEIGICTRKKKQILGSRPLCWYKPAAGL